MGLFVELVLLDADDMIVAAGWSVPLGWNGEPADLPTGYTDSLACAVDGHRCGTEPDTLVIAAAQVHPDLRGRGAAGEMLTAMRGLAEQRGWARAIAPVRPTLKARLPVDTHRGVRGMDPRRRRPLDPWVRTHWRLGARIIGTAPRSQTMTGTVAEWEDWSGMAFPTSGEYVIPDGLATLRIDRDADRGTYVEPGVWLQHR